MDLIDTHCHLNFKAFTDDFLEVAKKAKSKGVAAIVIPGSNIETSKRAIFVCDEINEKLGNNFAFAAIGIHPIHAEDTKNFAEIEELTSQKETIAIGEAGIDRFHLKNEGEIATQKELFKKHIDLSIKAGKPLIIHNREADADMLKVLGSWGFSHDREKKNTKLPKMVFHCFSSDWKFAQKILAMGAYISFTGNITYANKKIKKVIERVPLDRVMIETDAPYLAPEPEKSSGVARNEPSYVWRIARKIAEVKNLSLEAVCSQTTKNAKKFFRI